MEKNTYPVEEWKVTEEKFVKEWNYRNETTFALSNGYIGTRGTFDEGYPFSVDEGLEGNFINGFYESEHIMYGEWNFGFPEKSQSLLNLPNLKKTTIEINGEMFDLRTGEIVEYSRSLLMNEGTVVRNVVWKSPKGREVKATFKRLVSLADKNIMAIQIKVTPINFEGTVKFNSYIEAGVENHTRKTNPLIDYGPYGKHLIVRKVEADNDYVLYEGETKNTKFGISCGSAVVTEGHMTECVIGEEDGHTSYEIYAEEGKEVSFEKMIAYTSELDMPREEILPFIRAKLSEAKLLGYDKYEELQKEKMDEFWSKADIKIEGDSGLQQGIRFNLFHIMQSAGRDGRTGMGAKGLSGEGYEGHYFWDTEMYVLPVFVYTDSELAKQLLNYRYDTLNQARDRAKILGHMKGALYPWRTINGEEASTYFPLGTAQYHINADIAYAFKLYLDITGDDQYLIDKAAEVLVETARVWADVGCFAECKDNKYCICAVTGPDEYNAIVDNNFYTNLMARENIRSAMWALDRMKNLDKNAYNKLVEKLELEDEELEYWEKIINNMYFPFDEKLQIYPQDDGFLMRKPWDESKIPEEKRHLLYENYHPLFVYRQRMAKQADATDVYMTSRYDMHYDHAYFGLFGIEAIKDIQAENNDFQPTVHEAIIHSHMTDEVYPKDQGNYGWNHELDTYLGAWQHLDGLEEKTMLNWSERENVLTPYSMRQGPFKYNLKDQALRKYSTEYYNWIASFSKVNEVFYKHETNSIGSLATVTASSENSSDSRWDDQSVVKAVDGVADGYATGLANLHTRFPWAEWATKNEGAGAWLSLAYDEVQKVTKIKIYDRPNTDDHITNSHLEFDDGTTLEVGELPNDGSVKEISLGEGKEVKNIKFVVDEVSESTTAVGLAEIEVIK